MARNVNHPDIITIVSKIKMPLMDLPVKMTLVRIAGSVILISPTSDIEYFQGTIKEFGRVTDIVAPNLFHHLGIRQAVGLFPEARVWGVSGIQRKQPSINWNELIDESSWPYANDLIPIFIKGMPKMNECVFLHKASRTLIVADLCFNHVHGKGLGYSIIFGLFGTYKRFAVSKFYLKMVKNKDLFEQSVAKVMSLDFDRIIVPHGEDILENAHSRLTDAFRERGFCEFA